MTKVKTLTKKVRKGNLESIEELKESIIKSKDHCRCLIIDESNISWGYRTIASNLIPDGSIPVVDNGLLYLLSFNGTKLSPIEYMPTDNADKTPEDCFEAQYWEELFVILNLGGRLLEKIKLIVFIILAFFLVIVLFLISAIAMGG